MLDIEIEQARFGPADHDSRNDLIAFVPREVREAPASRYPAEEGHMRFRRAPKQLHERNDGADQNAVEDPGTEDPKERGDRDDKFLPIINPQMLQCIPLE